MKTNPETCPGSSITCSSGIPERRLALVAGESIRRSCWFAAPEAMGLWWRKALKLLIREVGEPREDWQRKVSDIFRGKP